MKYFEWEGAVTEAVAELMAIGHSDAAGIVEAQPFYMQQSWGKGMDAQLTAAKVVEAAQEQAEERAVAMAAEWGDVDAYNESALQQLAQKVEEMAESLVPDD